MVKPLGADVEPHSQRLLIPGFQTWLLGDRTMTKRRTAEPIVAIGALTLLACGFFGAAATSAAAVATDNLIVHYDFSEGSGTTITDLSGNGNDGTLVGNEYWLTGQLEFGYAYVDLPDGLLANQTEATVVVEANSQLVGGNQFLWNMGGLGHSNYGTGQFFVDPLRPRAAITATNWTAEQNAQPDFKLTADEWVSITATIEPNAGSNTSTLSLYFDGALVAQNSNSSVNLADLTDHTRNFIGKSAYEADGYYRGKVSSFLVYSQALDQQAIAGIAAESAEATAQEVIDNLDLAGANSQDLAALEFDMTLPTDGGVVWSSSHPEIISADGVVNPAATQTTVTLTATAQVRDAQVSKDFPVTVIAKRDDAEIARTDLAEI